LSNFLINYLQTNFDKMKKMFTHWKHIAFLMGMAMILPQLSVAQSDCGTTWYDTGGPTGAYSNSENYTTTFCPDNDGDLVTVTFTSFQTETNWDKLYVYDGPTTASPQISSGNGAGSGPCNTTGGFWGNLNANLPGPFVSTHPSGCLTFNFCSDGSVTNPGWAANITCAPQPNCTSPVMEYVQQERDCENLNFAVTVTVTAPSPGAAPLLLVTATADGATIPGVGGVINNAPGASIEVMNLPLDADISIEVNVLGFSCPTFATFNVPSNGCPIPLECGVALEQTYCYGNNESTPFLYVSPDGEPVTILFNNGLINTFGDLITIYDGEDEDGEQLFTGTNNGSLAGLSAVAESGSLYMVVTSDAFTSCTDGSANTSAWNWIVGCNLDIPGCTDPEAVNFQPVATEDDGSCIVGGNVCTDPVIVGDLPYTSIANTNLFGDDYEAANLPPQAPNAIVTGGYSGLYLGGDDAVYSYTPAEDGFIDVSATQTSTWVGLWVFTGCPFTSGLGAHTGSDGNGRFINALPVQAGTTYYVVISTWPAPQFTPYTLNIQNTVFDCPDFNANVGGFCEFQGGPGQLNDDCECGEVEFDGCTGDFVAFGGLQPNCDAPVTVTNANFGNFHEVPVLNGAVYTFSATLVSGFPLQFITISNQTGTEILATGAQSVTWTSTFNGTVRFYSDANAECTNPGFFSHSRTVEVDCETIIWDCPDLEQNIGATCLTDTGFGLLDENCDCDEIDFDGCLTGVSFGSANPTCDAPDAQIGGVWNGEFSTITVLNGGTYTFSTSLNPAVPQFFITITNSTGTQVLATGLNSMTWQSTLNGQVRMYTHAQADCGGVTGGASSHTRFISLDCSTLIYDCPDLELNFGQPCELADNTLGLVNDDCECGAVDFDGCTTGFLSFTVGQTDCNAPFNITFVSPASYNNVNVFNGVEYTFSHSTPVAGPFLFITITNATGTEILATGLSSVDWTSTLNGQVRFYTHAAADCITPPGTWTHTRTITANCATQIFDCPDLGANIGTSCDADGSDGIVSEDCECIELIGTDCTNPFVVTQANLPYNMMGNTATFGNNYTSANVPAAAPGAISTGTFSTVYLNGDDVAFEFTPDTDTFIDISVTGHGSWVGLWAFTNCPFTSTVGWHTGAGNNDGRFINQLPVVAGTTYYVVISTWPAPQNTTFNITISETVFDCPDLFANIGSSCDFNGLPGLVNSDCECDALVGTDCTNPFVVTQPDLPYTLSGNTSTFGNNYVAANVPAQAPGAIGTGGFSNFYLNGDDVSFEFTPDTDTFIDISVTNHGAWVGLWAFTNCPFTSTVGWHTGAGTNDGRFINALPVQAGTTYYVVISTWPAPQNTAFTLNISETVFDCPEFNANIGGFCELDGGVPGELDANCECQGIEFDGCTGDFSAGILSPNCDAPASQTNANFGNYHEVPVLNGAAYTFTAGLTTASPFQFLTITNQAGTSILATGVQSLTWTSDFNGTVRFYSDANVDCINPGFFSHSRTVVVDCSGIITDCPDLELNIGDICLTDTGFGSVNENCECDEIDFDGCTDGVQFGSAAPTCDLPNATVFGAWNGEFSNITVLDGGDYTFSTSENPAVPTYFITITNSTGTTVLATGINTASWTSTFNGTVRFYTHAQADCGGLTGGASSHTRFIDLVCAGVVFDCEDLEANFGDSCTLPGGGTGAVNEDCECEEVPCVATPPVCVVTGSVAYSTVIANDSFCCDTSWDGICQSAYDALSTSCTGGTDCEATPPACVDIESDDYATVIADDVFCCDTEWDEFCQSAYDALNDSCDEVPVDCPVDPGCAVDVSSDAYETVVTNDPFCCDNSWDSVCQTAYEDLGGLPSSDPSCITVFDIIANSEVHNTLETAIVEAALDSVLSSEGSFTVFAPTDEAFEALPDGLLADLLADPSGLLTDILLYHVVGSVALSTDLADGQMITTLLGEDVTVTINGDGVFINDAQVIIADLLASNGVVHVIDAVLLPPVEELPTIFDIVAASEVHNTLETALLEAGLDGALSNPEDALTLFAPTDAAFEALPDGLLADLLADPSGLLTDILLYHVVGSVALSTDLADGQEITTLLGLDVVVTINGDGVFINDAQVIIADILASNGVVHVIDAVLVPEFDEPSACENATAITAQPTFAESEFFTSMLGETASGVEQCTNADNEQPDQWFSFESVATVMYIRGWGLEDFDAAVEVYNACGDEVSVCQNDEPAGEREIVILTNTTPGETYYFRVYHGGAGTPGNLDYSVAVAHIPFTKLMEEDCEVFDYTPADIIRTELPPNQFLLSNWYFEFTELEAPFNTYEILSLNGSNPNFKLEWFPQAEYGRTYSVRTRAKMYQGPNWGDYGDACTIGFSATPLTTQLKEELALGFYDMCDILEADNVPGAQAYRWRIMDGFNVIIYTTPNRFLPLQDVPGLNLGSPYAVRVRAYTLGQWSPFGLVRLFAMNNFVPETGVDTNINTCGATYPLSQVLSAVEICAAEFYTWRFTNVSDATQPDLFYTRDDGLRTIQLTWVDGLIPGDTYSVQVLGGSGGLTGTYGYACEITIAGGSAGLVTQPDVLTDQLTQYSVNLYPNPSRGDEVMITVDNLTDAQNEFIIEVYDIYGKKVHSENFANNGSSLIAAVNFQKPMAAGIYTVNIISNDELIGARKLVVQK
jgi:uncharacterized surface protein with fasciclin (FAS1) repeats